MIATAINCMDGRVQVPVIDFIKAKYGAEIVDMITKPGADLVVSESEDDDHFITTLRQKLDISIDKRGSKLVAVVGHHDCTGNPVDEATHVEQIKSAVERVRLWHRDVKVVGLWVGEGWTVEEVE